MKKTIILFSAVCLLVTLINARPVKAIDPLGAGVAIGVGASMLFGGLINAHNYHHTAYVPAPVYQSYGYYGSPPPAYYGGWAYRTPYYGHSGYYHRASHYGHSGHHYRTTHSGRSGDHPRRGGHHYRPR